MTDAQTNQALSKTPRMSTSEIIQMANAPVTETAATDLLDRGLYAQSSARFSQLADADPESARLRRFTNVTAYDTCCQSRLFVCHS